MNYTYKAIDNYSVGIHLKKNCVSYEIKFIFINEENVLKLFCSFLLHTNIYAS